MIREVLEKEEGRKKREEIPVLCMIEIDQKNVFQHTSASANCFHTSKCLACVCATNPSSPMNCSWK